MPVAGWSRLWRADRGESPHPGALVRAAVHGESIAGLLELAAQALLHVGRAERTAVWLINAQSPGILHGVVAEAGSELTPEEWKRLDVSSPFWRSILDHADPVVTERGEFAESDWSGALVGMQSAVCFPLRVRQRALGLAVVAYTHARLSVDPASLRTVADELTLAVAQRGDHERAESNRAELGALAQFEKQLLLGAPPGELLRQMAREATRSGAAEFMALGRSSPRGVPGAQIELYEGPREWVAWAEAEPLKNLWCAAHEQGQAVEVGWEALESLRPQGERGPAQRVVRVRALPLEVRGQRLGVLLAGLSETSDPAAQLERLEFYATQACAALWEERCQATAAGAEAAHRALFETTEEWLLIVDGDGLVQQASRSALAQLPLDPAQLTRVRLEELFAPASSEAVAAWRAGLGADPPTPPTAAMEGTLPSGQRVRLHLRPGAFLPAAALAQPGIAGHWQVALEDVAARRDAEGLAAHAEAELRTLLDSLDTGVLLLDRDGRLHLVNDRFAQILGLEARRITELGGFDALLAAVAGRFAEPRAFAEHWRERLRRGDEASWDELELVRPTRKVVERFARPVFDAAGERIGWLEVYRDITGQRLIQSKLLQTEKMAALGQLVSGIAHELNNPLTTIMGYAQLLLGRQAEQDQCSDARMIYQEADRAGRIVRNLLLFAREAKPERRAVNLNEIVERTLALRSYEMKVENIHVDTDLDPDLPPTLADAAQMQQVILNLMVNAEQAIQQGRHQGRIRVRTRRLSEQRLALEVSDDGPGIAPEVASRVFDPFFTTKPVGVGTGLGLSIVYGIVQEHGGEIYVESQPGRGASFVMELPVLTAAAAHAAAGAAALAPPVLGAVAERRAASRSNSGVPARRERILVVEDEPTVAQLIADVLGEEGRRVDMVLDSREGLERLGRQNYDLVICDLKMPHLDGRAFYRSLVRTGNPLQHRLIFVTGDTLAPHTVEFLESSGVPYLAKPFLVEELKTAVERALTSAASPGAGLAAGAEPSSWPRGRARKS